MSPGLLIVLDPMIPATVRLYAPPVPQATMAKGGPKKIVADDTDRHLFRRLQGKREG